MKYIMIRMIRFYQKYLSPLKSTKCPYYPTCSQLVWKRFRNMEPSRAVYLRYGEFFDAILFQREDMTRYHKRES